MAKLKNKSNSKYQVKLKRKFLDGGPYKDVEKELYLNDNVTYQASTPPTSMLQNQFDAQEQEKAKRMTAIYGDQFARQLDYLQDQNAQQTQRKADEKAVKQAEEQAVVDNAQKQVVTAGTLAGKEIAKNISTVGTVSRLPKNVAGPVISKADAKIMGVKGAGRFAGEGVSKFSYGSNLANLGVGLGLGLSGELVGYLGNKRDDKKMEQEGRSQYYDDTHYSRAEFNSQLGKSTLKGAGMGSAFGPVGTGIGAGVGALYGLGKALHERRQTTGKNWFGEKNVYDENLDPTVIEKRNREAQLKAMTDTATAMDNARMSSMMQSDVNTGFAVAKYGGNIKYLKGGVAKSLGRGAVEYVGKKHEHGGIDLPGNIEVEGGETEQNDYVFSATLKLPNGQTYAQAHKTLLKSGASGEEIHQLALSQEAAAGRNPNEIKSMKFAKYGGPLKYVDGGKKDGSDLDEMTLTRIHANEGVGPNGLTTPYIDSKGYWTVGRGHLMVDSKGKPYTSAQFPTLDKLPANVKNVTKEQVETWAKTDYENSKKIAQNWIGKDTWEALPDSVKSGTIELAYGLGPNKLKDFKQTKEAIVSGDYEKAGEQIYRTGYYQDVKPRRGNLVVSLIGGNEEVLYNAAQPNQYTVPLEYIAPFANRGTQGVKYDNTKLSYTSTKKDEPKPVATTGTENRKIVQIPGAYGSMVDAYWDPQSGGNVMTEQGKKAQEDIVRIKQEQDANVANWGMGLLTGVAGGVKSAGMFAAKKAGQFVDDILSEEEAASNVSQNTAGARTSGASTNVTRPTGVPYRNTELNTNLSNFKPFGQESGLATEGQWMADAGAVSDEALGFPRPGGNTQVGPYRPENGYINITGRTINKPPLAIGQGVVTDPRAQLNLGDALKFPLPSFGSEKFKEDVEKIKEEAKKKKQEEVIVEPTPEETTETNGTADTSGLQDKYKLPKISAGPFNRPEYPVRTAEEVKPPKEKYDLSEIPEEKKDYSALLGLMPAVAASFTPNFKTTTPSLVSSAGSAPGAIGRVTFNRETDRQLIAENARTAAAMQEAASMQGGPGALAALGRAQVLKSDADLKAAGMVQAKNAEINAREAAANASISAQNIANVNQYENRRLQQDAMNANILNTTNQLNTDIKNKEKYLKYATGVEVAQNVADNMLGYKKDQNAMERDKEVAMAMDQYHTLERRDFEKRIMQASKDKNSKYYNTDPVTARAMARQYIQETYPDQMKLGGQKYVSRLGSLVNKRNKRF